MKQCNHLVFRISILFFVSMLCITGSAQQDSAKAKQKLVFKSARLYKGVAVESITPNADYTMAVVKTIDGNTYTLTREQLKQALDITLTNNGWILPNDASIVYYDKNGVPGESYKKDEYINVTDNTPTRIYTERRYETTTNNAFKPFYIIDGKDATSQQLQELKPNDIYSLNVLKPDSAVKLYGDKGKNGVIVISTKKLKEDISNPKLETKASFPGGINGWRRYLEQNLRYPVAAQEKGTQGIVRVQMTVDKTGKIAEVSALNDPGDGLAVEAVRVVKTGPDWIPATQKGEPITYKFVQTITFKIGSGANGSVPISPFRFNQSIVVKTAKLYNGQSIKYILPTYDSKGADVILTDGRSYFINRDEAMQQFGLVITDKGFVAPDDAQVIYIDNNGVVSDNYEGLKFVGGQKSFRTSSLFQRGATPVDVDKQPIIILNGKKLSVAEVQVFKPYEIRSSNLLTFQDAPAIAKFGNQGKNGLLMLSTKLPYPDNYLYLLNGEEFTNEALAKLPPRTVKRMTITVGNRGYEKYGDKAKYGVVVVDTVSNQGNIKYDTVFSKLERPATFPGGEEGWRKYVTTNMRYPEVARKNKTEGTVRVGVTISADGTVKEVSAYNSPADGLAQEAVRLVKESPQWIPAKLKGVNVVYRLIIPVVFKIDPTNYF